MRNGKPNVAYVPFAPYRATNVLSKAGVAGSQLGLSLQGPGPDSVLKWETPKKQGFPSVSL